MLKKEWLGLAKDWGKDLVIALLLALVLRAGVADAREVPTPSMVPTVMPGDRVFVERVVMKVTGLAHGNIIVFTPPPEAHSTDDFLKRVIGLPGDTVEVRDQKVLINGQPLTEPYVAEAPTYQYGPVKVPAGKVFVLGDNRNASFDSHRWGLLDISAIHGRAWVRYWPLNRVGLLG